MARGQAHSAPCSAFAPRRTARRWHVALGQRLLLHPVEGVQPLICVESHLDARWTFARSLMKVLSVLGAVCAARGRTLGLGLELGSGLGSARRVSARSRGARPVGAWWPPHAPAARAPCRAAPAAACDSRDRHSRYRDSKYSQPAMVGTAILSSSVLRVRDLVSTTSSSSTTTTTTIPITCRARA